jgi:outer membrane protein assembly factor BamB
MRTTLWGLLPALVANLAPAQDRVRYRDPAPPRVAVVSATPVPTAPAATTYEEHRAHSTPRPLPAGAETEDWPGFLGPRRDGHSRETGLLDTWPPGGPALIWSMRCGEGFASPAIQGERLVFPHRVGDRTFIDCLHAETGLRFWRFGYRMAYKGVYIRNAGPPSTPLIDGDRVYMHGVEGKLHCLGLATGAVIWQRDLKAEFGLANGFFGVVSSPLVFGDLLLVNLGARGPCVAAFDKHRGRMIWGAGDKWGQSCASPVVAEIHGRPRLLVLGGGESRPPTGGLLVLDPQTGVVASEFPFRSRTYESVLGATPVVAGNRVFLTAAYNTGSVALDLDPEGGCERAWTNKRFGIEFATPIYQGGHLYVVDGKSDRAGAVVCLDPDTGHELSRTDIDWAEKVIYQGRATEVSLSIGNGSLLHAGGRFLCLGDNGHLLHLECGPKGAKVLARVSLFHASQSWTPLVLSRGLLYACQNNPERFGAVKHPPRLLCYDLRGR